MARNDFAMDASIDGRNGNPLLVLSLLLIAGLGIASLYSASYGYAVSLGKPASYFAVRQLMWLGVSFFVFTAASCTPLSFMQSMMAGIVLFSIILLLLPFVPAVGVAKNGAARWIGIGGQMFQPSELFKPVLILYLAHILSKKADKLSDVVNGVIPPFLVAALAMFIVLQQNDFSTALLIGILAVVMFWIAEVPLIFFGALASIGLPLVALSVLTSDYRLKRVLGFLAPAYDPADLSYQVNGSLRAIRAGGIWGKGIGQGTLKIRSIPEVQSDFVFSAWVEETGFMGVMVFISIWAVFLVQAFRIAFRSEDTFRSYLAFGSAAYLAIQMLTNVMVAVGAIPATGIPLPFFSAGGSSLVSSALAAGFICNVSRSEASERKAAHG